MQSGNNRYESRIRKARKTRGLLIAGAAILVLCIGLVLLLRAVFRRAPEDINAQQAQTEQTQGALLEEQLQPDGDDDDDATVEGDDAPQSGDPAESSQDELESVELLQIIRRKKDEKKKIAITVDDCLSASVTRSIAELAQKHNIGITFFPKGNTIKKNAQLWRDIYEMGFEIENHTHTHTKVSKLKGDDLKKNIQQANDALNEALGVNYHMRLFRCPTGDGERSARLHAVLKELGYEAVASWGLSGTPGAAKTLRAAQGGQIILFHANQQSDLTALKKVIPGLIERGFELVTVNELYGKGPNLVTPLEGSDAAA